MKFTFKNLGIFEKETILELGDLTIICGQNNTGKTYASYAIFGFLDTWSRNITFDIPDQKIQELYRTHLTSFAIFRNINFEFET